MQLPAFFAKAPGITLADPLLAFLGASPDQLITYQYEDVVKLAGHSCPTVAGTYLMVRRALQYLYGADMPERGAIEVYLRDSRDAGTTGVVAFVATLLTGAAPETGFGGIGRRGRFRRRNLMHFDAPIQGLMGLRRMDNGAGVVVDLDTSVIPADARMSALFLHHIAGATSPEEAELFGRLWQQRVEIMLLRHADDPAMLPLMDWPAA